ncbi:hypothetical protein NQ314_005884 [Rhamnusium bicolor]|uniref:Thioredoxin domain-containing protein n=1 Tax=Rhamnusium bicolor TaxID=1586634 RepID=A0AAV8ZDC8_9CUCU|nr:hypothetical protein NQ314_005884 [Rhamnusium bicolor]
MPFLLFLISIIPIFSNIFAHEDDIHTFKYNTENFSDQVSKKNHFVMFYAPWCGHCQRLAPTWEQLAEMLNEDDSNIKIGKVDCTTDSKVCSEQDVTGYPTLKFFKEGDSEGVKFRGTRDLPSLTTFINEQLREKLAPTWEQLAKSLEIENDISIGKVDCTQHRSVCNNFEVKGYPTLLWIEDGKKVDKYQGDRSHEDLKQYVNKMLGSDQENQKQEDQEAGIPGPVGELTGDSFKNGIQSGVTFVKFYAPWCGHCKRLSPTWDNLGKKFSTKPGVNIVKVDCTLEINKQLCNDEEVEGFPTIFLYKDGGKISEYSGSRSLDDLYDFVNKHLGHDEL